MDSPLYASMLRLDRTAIKALKITDPYSIHRTVYSLFQDVRSEGEKNKSKSSGIVYNDEGGNFQSRKILMISDRMPASCVNGQYGEVETKKINSSLLKYENYRFKTTVNPCRRNNKTRQLIPVKGRENIAQWFIERSNQSWGFDCETPRLQVNDVEVLRFKGKNRQLVTIVQAAIEGELKVTDRDAFIRSFRQGIGRARSFGCGLLQIVPLSHNPLY